MSPDSKSAVWVQFVTRVPRRLHHDMKLHCVAHNVTIVEFVADAVSERLLAAAVAGRGVAPPLRRPVAQKGKPPAAAVG